MPRTDHGSAAITEKTKERRAAKRQAAAARRQAFWDARLRATTSRRRKVQVMYDRLRGIGGRSCPPAIKEQVWDDILAELAELVVQLEAGIDRYKDGIHARGELIRPRTRKRRWFDWL